MNKLAQWFSERPHTKAMYITAVATVVMAVMSGVMCMTVVQNRASLQMAQQALQQTQEALQLTRKSVSLQEQEFGLRNRPFVVQANVRFAGATLLQSGQSYPRSVQFDITNISEIPANKLEGAYRLVLNGKQIKDAKAAPAALAKGFATAVQIGMTEEDYVQAIAPGNRFDIQADITYSGMLTGTSENYRTLSESYWSHDEKNFKYNKMQFD